MADYHDEIIIELQHEIERLRGLITKWADAEYEEHVVYGGPWTVRANEAYDALRKAVGR